METERLPPKVTYKKGADERQRQEDECDPTESPDWTNISTSSGKSDSYIGQDRRVIDWRASSFIVVTFEES